jgi:hypothetical protein
MGNIQRHFFKAGVIKKPYGSQGSLEILEVKKG